MPSEPLEPPRDAMDLGAVLSAIADPLRRQVIQELVRSEEGIERTCASFGLPISKSTRSHHFRVLREAGLVKQVDHGNFSGVTLRRTDIQERFPGLLELLSVEEKPTGFVNR